MARQTDTALRIGEVAKLTGASVPTIRFYEAQGLLRSAPRGSGGQRLYDAQALAALRFVLAAREFDFPLPTIRRLLDLRDDVGCTCDGLLDFGKQQLDALRAKLARLAMLEAELNRITSACEATCIGGPAQDCAITVHFDRTQRHRDRGFRD